MPKYALLIGINYYGSQSQLSGCVNDVLNVYLFLTNKLGYEPKNITLLCDKITDRSQVLGVNIKKYIKSCVDKLCTGDSLYVHYSGHGTLVRDSNGDEKQNPFTPGYDCAICPVDYENGLLTDDYLCEELVNKIPTGCKLRAVFDCCHSGTALDLEYIMKPNGVVTKIGSNEKNSDDILLISGCRDDQTSADTIDLNDVPCGALTDRILSFVKKDRGSLSLTWKKLIKIVQEKLTTDGYSQYPILSLSNPNLANRALDW